MLRDWSNLAKIVYKRTYARQDESGQRETWSDTVKRVIEGNVGKYRGTKALAPDEESRLNYFLLNRKAGPAGRGWWFSGAPSHADIGGAALVNCWFMTSDDWYNFVIAMDLLMLGGGVGLSVENRYCSKLPRVRKGVSIVHHNSKDADFIVPDSRSGWCTLLERILDSYFVSGKSFTYSTVCVRGMGERIKGFGGTSSGPRPLVDFTTKLCGILGAREGKHVRPVDAMDMLCATGELVVSGNVRRSALIILGDPWDKDYLTAKRWDLGLVPTYRSCANLSVVCDDTDDLHPLFWKTYENGEPFGIINRKNIRSFGRMGEKKKDTAIGVNPCVVGDTLVAVADGRDHVSIRDLAQAGRDTPVYCLDADGKPAIRLMRNPRITGVKQPVLRVLLDDGSSLRVTPNHKFLTKQGTYKAVSEIQPGERLFVLGKRQEPNPVKMYWRLQCNNYNLAEHRLIAEHFNGGPIAADCDVHHIDLCSLNNLPENLQILDKGAHSQAHSDLSVGELNPRWSGFSNDEVFQHIKELTASVGCRLTLPVWIEYADRFGLPKFFSKHRLDAVGPLYGLFVKAADELGIEDVKERAISDPKDRALYRDLLAQGYVLDVEGACLIACKQCPKCGVGFRLPVARREVTYCSSKCANLMRDPLIYKKAGESIKNAAQVKHLDVRKQQIGVFKKLFEQNNQVPKKMEWVAQCREDGVSPEVSRPSSPFKCWADLVSAAENTNHRVVSIIADGFEDVYSGTVDEFHNYFVGGFESVSAKKHYKKFIYVNNLNCGEATLENKEPCNLQEIPLPNLASADEFEESARLMHRWGKRVTLEPYHYPEIQEVIDRNRRIGTGITGCLQNTSLFNPAVLDRVYGAIQDENQSYSKLLGIPESIRTTVVKPSGTLSKMYDCSEGIHAAYSRHFIQRVRFSSGDTLLPLLRGAGHYMEPEVKFDGNTDPNTMVVDFYVRTPDGTPVADEDWDTWKQLETLKLAQKHWADQAVSVTVYYRKSDIGKVKEWLADNLKYVKTISFLCHNDHGFKQAPKEAISRELFEERAEKIKPLEVDEIEGGDLESLECASGFCPVK